MAKRGTTISNPTTGERIEFRRTARDTHGAALEYDYYLAPGGFAAGKFDHVHPRQEERFSVKKGSLGVRINGDEWTATSGTRFAVLPKTSHTIWNAGDTEMHARVQIRPALEMEAFFETMYGLAREGKTDSRGLPGPLQLAVIADEFREELRIPGVPGPVQTALISALGSVGRAAGYRAWHPRYAGD